MTRKCSRSDPSPAAEGADASTAPDPLCKSAIDATEAMLALRRLEAEYRAARRANGPPQWSKTVRRTAARRVRDASARLRERLDHYASVKEALAAAGRTERRNPK